MLIRDATLPGGDRRDVRVRGEVIESVAPSIEPKEGERILPADGKRLFPGMIDAHVHFRQPGASHKETWLTGTKAAAAGGVTTVVDQPNTTPPTVDGASFDRKLEFAEDAIVDFGINGGVTEDWLPRLLFRRPLFALGEVFLADSTGDMGIGAELFETAVAEAAEQDVPITVHAEDASLFNQNARERDDPDAWSAYRTARAEIAAVEQALEVADDYDVDMHIAHASTPEGIDRAADAGATCEVTPHHMLLSRADVEELGSRARMNPPLRREGRRAKVYQRVVDGTVDIIATDHAPHSPEEKDQGVWEAPSGVPGVQWALPLLLEEARTGELTYERVRDLTARNPARVFGLSKKGRIERGAHADLVLVDPDNPRPITTDECHSKCGWTPYEGREGLFPLWTMVRGTVVYERQGVEDAFRDYQGQNVRASTGDGRLRY